MLVEKERSPSRRHRDYYDDKYSDEGRGRERRRSPSPPPIYSRRNLCSPRSRRRSSLTEDSLADHDRGYERRPRRERGRSYYPRRDDYANYEEDRSPRPRHHSPAWSVRSDYTSSSASSRRTRVDDYDYSNRPQQQQQQYLAPPVAREPHQLEPAPTRSTLAPYQSALSRGPSLSPQYGGLGLSRVPSPSPQYGGLGPSRQLSAQNGSPLMGAAPPVGGYGSMDPPGYAPYQ